MPCTDTVPGELDTWFEECRGADVCLAVLSTAFVLSERSEDQITYAKDSRKRLVAVAYDHAGYKSVMEETDEVDKDKMKADAAHRQEVEALKAEIAALRMQLCSTEVTLER